MAGQVGHDSGSVVNMFQVTNCIPVEVWVWLPLQAALKSIPCPCVNCAALCAPYWCSALPLSSGLHQVNETCPVAGPQGIMWLQVGSGPGQQYATGTRLFTFMFQWQVLSPIQSRLHLSMLSFLFCEHYGRIRGVCQWWL
jgi:hypothetical protein